MPTINRSRTVAAERADVWTLLADPHNLPRWWPETSRVEAVEGTKGTPGLRFTQVLTTSKGKPVRADFSCEEATEGERLVWSQDLEGTPFEGFMTKSTLKFELADDGDRTTKVAISAHRGLRGLSKLGSPMMRKATGELLERALDGIETAVGRRSGALR